jgi:hypothetical protein
VLYTGTIAEITGDRLPIGFFMVLRMFLCDISAIRGLQTRKD